MFVRQWPSGNLASDPGTGGPHEVDLDALLDHIRRLRPSRSTRGALQLPCALLIQARQQLERALSLEEKDHPEGTGVAALLLRLGNMAERRDDIEEADRLYRRAYELLLRLAPGSGGEAAAATNLAITTGWRGDVAQAERYAARALAIREKLTPSGDAIIPSLLNHGILLAARGDFAGAEASVLRARRILEGVQPESTGMVKVLENLGGIAWLRQVWLRGKTCAAAPSCAP